MIAILTRLGLPWLKYALIAGGVLVVVQGLRMTYDTFYASAYQRGWTDAMSEVSKVNSEAAAAARQVRVPVHVCFDSGGTWDVAQGLCIR